MNTGQMLITLSALFLLSMVVLNVNKNFLTTNSSLLTNKQTLSATSLATSIIEEATGKAFDEKTVGKSINTKDPSIFTPSSTLGPEGEKYIDKNGGDVFDDFDDFNGLVDSVEIPGSGYYKFWVEVSYLDDAFNKTSSREFHKLLTVKVTNSAMLSNYYEDDYDKPDTVKMSFIYSYWY